MKNNSKIKATKNGPYIVEGLEEFKKSNGDNLLNKQTMALCRCGHSSTKPFCDGTHVKINFDDKKLSGRQPDRMDDYNGKELTIHDNRGVCSHAGYCTDNSPKVFRMNKEPWIDPDCDEPEKTKKTIKMCPSGALSYADKNEHYKNQDKKPGIKILKNGHYRVAGGPEYSDEDGNQPESSEHYTLCRCGGSKNKPFCDGSHWSNNFSDPDN